MHFIWKKKKKENQSWITTINYIDVFIFSYVFVSYPYWNLKENYWTKAQVNRINQYDKLIFINYFVLHHVMSYSDSRSKLKLWFQGLERV